MQNSGTFDSASASAAGASSKRGSALATKYNQMLGCIGTDTIDDDLQTFMVDVMALKYGDKAKMDLCTGLIQARANAAIKLHVFEQMEKIKQTMLEMKTLRMQQIKAMNTIETNDLITKYEEHQND